MEDGCYPEKLYAHEHQIQRALNWLLHSGIQSKNGGVARFYRSDRQINNPVSTEITGYHAGTLAWLYTATGNQEALSRAIETADFLVDKAWDATLRTFPFEYPHPSPTYFFDNGIIVRGLLAVWSITQTPRYWEVAQTCAERMVLDFDAGFDFHPILSLPSKVAELRDPRWSRSSGCYQLKAAVGWHEISHATEHKELYAAWDRLRIQAIEGHDEFLPGHTDQERVVDRLHAYCYFLEALLATPQNPECSRAIAVGTQRVAYLLHKIAPAFVRSDVYAQLLRIRIYADHTGALPLDVHTAALEAEQLAAFQLTSTDARIDGGFCFGRQGEQMLPYVNPVSTDFAVQALHLWHLRQSGLPLPPFAGLV